MHPPELAGLRREIPALASPRQFLLEAFFRKLRELFQQISAALSRSAAESREPQAEVFQWLRQKGAMLTMWIGGPRYRFVSWQWLGLWVPTPQLSPKAQESFRLSFSEFQTQLLG
ncbi:hypothetical protein CQ018_13530 [Arthrobacter sp. MYb227]|nr:hypothetical protein CQ018_13530 [Arthrobacter sp. MYb227]